MMEIPIGVSISSYIIQTLNLQSINLFNNGLPIDDLISSPCYNNMEIYTSPNKHYKYNYNYDNSNNSERLKYLIGNDLYGLIWDE
jgi:hypothetical protein